jgi:hypothetical protein
MNINPNFYLYFGSETTPPCSENVFHITISKPILIPTCQFKLLRENSLVTNRSKEIHTRIEQPLSDRVVYGFNRSQILPLLSIEGLLPMSYNKYLLEHGSRDKLARLMYLAKKYGPNSKWAKKLRKLLALLGSQRRKKIGRGDTLGGKRTTSTDKKTGLYGLYGIYEDDIDCTLPENENNI